jgi:hypothetical protein
MSSDIVKRLRAGDTLDIGEAADRIQALEGEVAALKAAMLAIAVKAGTFDGRGSYTAYVMMAGQIEHMADAAIRAAAGGGE